MTIRQKLNLWLTRQLTQQEPASQPQPKQEALSSSKPIDPTDPRLGEAILASLRQQGIVPPHATVTVVDHRVPRPGIKPPADPEVDVPMAWSAWAQLASESYVKGWSPCRFAVRSGPDYAAHARFVFGATRGLFGVFRQPFYCCNEETGHNGEAIITSLVWLPSGFGLALFRERETAVKAADLIGTLLDEMPDMVPIEDVQRDWRERMNRVHQIWEFNGIVEAPDFHAHNGLGPASEYLSIRTQVPVEGVQPENVA